MRILAVLFLVAACGPPPADAPDAGEPPFTVDEPTALVTGLDRPNGIAADADAVYWVETGTIRRKDLGGGAAVELAGGIDTAQIALDDEFVYWANRLEENILRVPKAGGPIETIVAVAPYAGDVDSDGERIYWGDDAGIHSARPDGSDPRPLAPTVVHVADVSVDADRVYWVEGDTGHAVDKDGGAPIDLGIPISDVVSGGGRLFWTTRTGHAVVYADANGANPTPFVENVTPGRLRFVDGAVYWAVLGSGTTNAGPGGVWRAAPGETPVEVAPAPLGALDVAVVGDVVFFTESALGAPGEGAVWAAPR